jgi:hypothetical protein
MIFRESEAFTQMRLHSPVENTKFLALSYGK